MRYELYHVVLNGRDNYYVRWENQRGVKYTTPGYKETFVSDIDWLIRNMDDEWTRGVLFHTDFQFNKAKIAASATTMIAASDDVLDLKLQVPWLFL